MIAKKIGPAKKRAPKKEPEAAAASRLSDDGSAPPPEDKPVRVLGPGGIAFELQRTPKLKQMAMYWANVVRNRVRWAADQDALEGVRKAAVADLESLGLGATELKELSGGDTIEIDVPFTEETQGWEARILPWEFLLSTATAPYRGGQPMVVVRRLSRVVAAEPSAAPPFNDAPSSLMVVASLPGRLVSTEYDFTSELALVQSNLGLKPAAPPLQTPTLNMLTETIRTHSPDILHLTGIDLHQGYRLLNVKEAHSERIVDGYFMAAADGSAAPVAAAELAGAVNAASAKKPILVSCNFYYSAARTAALIVAGGAQAAIGLQDEIDDLVAEEFFTRFYRAWRELDWDLLRAFRVALRSTDVGNSKTGAGMVLWSSVPLLEAPQRTSIREDLAQVSAKRREGTGTGTGPGGGIDFARDLNADILPATSVNYSLLHNSQSLFKRFCLRNLNQQLEPMRGLRLHIELCAGEQNFPFRSMLDLEAGTLKELKDDIRIPLTSALFRSLRESIQSVLFVRASAGQTDLLERTYPVRLLAIDEWLDELELNAFLPSFVLPRDPAVLRVIDASQRHLMTLTDDPDAGFDGYQSVDEQGHNFEAVDLQVWAIWSALSHDFSLSYINPPPAFTDASQRLRSPSDVIDGKRGTCIDLALLLAACLEYVGIYPVLFLLKGHAFPGYWRSEEGRQRFVQVRTQPAGAEQTSKPPSPYPWLELEQSYDEVLQLLRAGDLAPIETVWLTQHKGYWDSRDAGVENLRSRKEFEAMIDVKGARDKGVTPLPVTRG